MTDIKNTSYFMWGVLALLPDSAPIVLSAWPDLYDAKFAAHSHEHEHGVKCIISLGTFYTKLPVEE